MRHVRLIFEKPRDLKKLEKARPPEYGDIDLKAAFGVENSYVDPKSGRTILVLIDPKTDQVCMEVPEDETVTV